MKYKYIHVYLNTIILYGIFIVLIINILHLICYCPCNVIMCCPNIYILLCTKPNHVIMIDFNAF